MILIYFLAGVMLGVASLLFIFQKQIIFFIWKLTARERLVKVIVHFESNFYKVYYRLIPENKFFLIQKMRYFYDKKFTVKGNVAIDKEENTITIDHKQYNFSKLFSISDMKKKNRFIEIHYFYNNPMPINFNPINHIIKKDIDKKFIGDNIVR